MSKKAKILLCIILAISLAAISLFYKGNKSIATDEYLFEYAVEDDAPILNQMEVITGLIEVGKIKLYEFFTSEEWITFATERERERLLSSNSLWDEDVIPQEWDSDRGPNWTDRILLTFDDCITDAERFIEVLDHATYLDIGLMIFPHGNCLTIYANNGLDFEQLVRERGHWIGNHSINHPNFRLLSREEIKTQVLGGAQSNIVRPPYGSFNDTVLEVLEETGQKLFIWNVDTNDWRRGMNRQRVVNNAVQNAQLGDSVLMHLQWWGFTAQALSEIKEGLSARGLELCRPAPSVLRPTPVEVPLNIC